MNKNVIKNISAILVLSMAFSIAACKKKDEYRVVKVENYEGEVVVDREGKDEDIDVFEGMKLASDDKVNVGASSNLELLVDSDKHLYADENTKFEIVATGNEKKGTVEIKIIDGSALIEIDEKLPEGSSFSVSTPNAVFSVRGTQFKVSYEEDTGVTTLEVIEGVVATEYENGAESEDIEAGDGRVVTSDEVVSIAEWTGTLDSNSNGSTTDGNTAEARAAFNAIISDMSVITDNYSKLSQDYVVKDYMYYDYNQDSHKDLILYLGYYNDDNVYCRDVVYIKYDYSDNEAKVAGIVTGEENDTHFYADYNGQLARYSWRTSPYESYIYIVYESDNSITYVLEAGFDFVISDLDQYDLTPLPLHGDWEILTVDS